ncbi:MAG: hypothetical protein MZU91_01215 [Desulfosudis oleivorans]|nr:hypothetical protein [Desulfosudis oleivorans]
MKSLRCGSRAAGSLYIKSTPGRSPAFVRLLRCAILLRLKPGRAIPGAPARRQDSPPGCPDNPALPCAPRLDRARAELAGGGNTGKTNARSGVGLHCRRSGPDSGARPPGRGGGARRAPTGV